MLKQEVEEQIEIEIKKFCKTCAKRFSCDSQKLLDLWKKMTLPVLDSGTGDVTEVARSVSSLKLEE